MLMTNWTTYVHSAGFVKFGTLIRFQWACQTGYKLNGRDGDFIVALLKIMV